MMPTNLLIDLGNTRLKWAVYDGQLPLRSVVMSHRGQDLAASLSAAWANLPRPGRVQLASVAEPSITNALSQWLQQQWALTPSLLISPAQGQGLSNSYAEPARLGCDRWAAMVAAYHVARAAVCVVDCGTAVTLDAVNAQGQHLGGLILPGLRAMQTALSRDTALAPVEFSQLAPGLLGTSTRDGIVRGISHAVSALVEQTVTELTRQSGTAPQCYLTGGDAEVIAPLLSIPYQVMPDLVLQGLAVIADAT
jgi:type III pantothenate kinase